MGLTFGLLGIAFYFTYRPRGGSQAKSQNAAPTRRSRMMTFNRGMLWVATFVAVVFLFFPQAMTNLFASSDEFTPEMQQTVITVEGMS